MKSKVPTFFYFLVFTFGLTAAAPFILPNNFGVYAQGNRISGYVFGLNRQTMDDLNVELLDDLHRTQARTLTSRSGYYEFSGMKSGTFTIKVYTLGTDYEEQENTVEIYNTGGAPTFEQSDFHLKLRRGISPASVAVFVQDVPPEAKKLYEKGLGYLRDKHDAEGLADLRSALSIFPKYFDALQRLGTEYVRIGKPETYQAAEILLAVAVEVNPRAYKSWYALGFSRYSLGKYSEALTAVQKAIELNAYLPDAIFLSGALMRRTGNFIEGEKQLLKAKELSKDTIPRVHWELALLYGNGLRRYAEAAAELKHFLKVQPAAKDTEKIKELIAEFEAKAAIK